jgi:uncharacterized protein DUF3303
MKVMIVWKTVPGKYNAALEAFLRGGGTVPPGATSLGRWHVPGSVLGWHLVEGDLTAIAQHVAEWADLLECEVYPVVEDAVAADAAKRVFGSK